MSVGSLDALKVRALLERVCSVPTTLTPDELSRVCAAQLSFAEVVSLAAQLTAVIQAHEITTPAAPAAGAGRPMSARRNGNTLGAQIHAVEHLHKSLQRTARGSPTRRSPPRTSGCDARSSTSTGRAPPRRRERRARPSSARRATGCCDRRTRGARRAPGADAAGHGCIVRRRRRLPDGGVLAAGRRPARWPCRRARRAAAKPASRRRAPPTPRGVGATNRRRRSAAVVGRGAPRRRALLESGWATGGFGSMPSPPA